jgi:TonB family protein
MAIYLLHSTVCFSILFFAYMVLLKSTTFFQHNRFYLLVSALLSLVFPLLPSFGESVEISNQILAEVIIGSEKTVAENSFSWLTLIAVIYFTGFFISLFFFIKSLEKTLRLVNSSRMFLQNGLYFFPENSSHTAFSFFGKIFIHPQLDIETQSAAIAHEKVHARQHHTLDILFYELLCVVFWFNPLYGLAKKQLAILHEFIADEVAAHNNDRVQYARVLTARAFGVPYSTVVNSFSLTNNLKRRLIMLNKTKTNRANMVRYFAAIPLVAVMLFFNSFTLPQPDEVFDKVEKMPEFKGGQQELINYLVSTITYPEDAKKAKLTGKVFVEFVVDKSGNVRDVKVKKSDNILFDAEALRVVSSMPDWVPGENGGKKVSVKLTLPISFAL